MCVCVLGRLCELGWLFRQIDGYIKAQAAPGGGGGLVAQAFCHALQAEMGEWYQLLAVLDAQRQSELSLVQPLVDMGPLGSATAQQLGLLGRTRRLLGCSTPSRAPPEPLRWPCAGLWCHRQRVPQLELSRLPTPRCSCWCGAMSRCSACWP